MKFRNYANPTDKENTVEVEYQLLNDVSTSPEGVVQWLG